jgi:hypothetical protein
METLKLLEETFSRKSLLSSLVMENLAESLRHQPQGSFTCPFLERVKEFCVTTARRLENLSDAKGIANY